MGRIAFPMASLMLCRISRKCSIGRFRIENQKLSSSPDTNEKSICLNDKIIFSVNFKKFQELFKKNIVRVHQKICRNQKQHYDATFAIPFASSNLPFLPEHLFLLLVQWALFWSLKPYKRPSILPRSSISTALYVVCPDGVFLPNRLSDFWLQFVLNVGFICVFLYPALSTPLSSPNAVYMFPDSIWNPQLVAHHYYYEFSQWIKF